MDKAQLTFEASVELYHHFRSRFGLIWEKLKKFYTHGKSLNTTNVIAGSGLAEYSYISLNNSLHSLHIPNIDYIYNIYSYLL